MPKQNLVSINISSCCLKISVKIKFTFSEEKIVKEKKCEIKECQKVAKTFVKCGIKECK